MLVSLLERKRKMMANIRAKVNIGWKCREHWSSRFLIIKLLKMSYFNSFKLLKIYACFDLVAWLMNHLAELPSISLRGWFINPFGASNSKYFILNKFSWLFSSLNDLTLVWGGVHNDQFMFFLSPILQRQMKLSSESYKHLTVRTKRLRTSTTFA